MKKLFVALACTLTLLAAVPVQAQQMNAAQLQKLQLSETQVQDLFSIFLSRAPELLGENLDSKTLMNEVAPQALNILTSEQRQVLSQLAPQEQLTRFGEMSQSERRNYMFDSARGLVHPSKREWLRRVEEMVE